MPYDFNRLKFWKRWKNKNTKDPAGPGTRDTAYDPFDPDIDARKLYGDHYWARSELIRGMFHPALSVFSKDYQQFKFLTMKKEERVKLVKEKASIMKNSYYYSLPELSDVVGRDKEISMFLNSIYYHILRHPDAVQQSLAPPKVYLVKGEPGSGKSFLIKATMREAFDRALEEGFILDLKPLEGAAMNAPFMGMYSGAVSGAFQDAQKRPTFLFIDEAQQLTQKGSNLNGDSASKEYQQAESAILTALDNIMSSPVRTIVVMGSNTSESIREDVRRRAFLIDLDTPGLTHDGMIEIVKRKLEKAKIDLDAETVLSALEQELRGLGEGRMVPHDISRAFDEVINESEAPLRESFLKRLQSKTKCEDCGHEF